jgi:hypothetical protein
MTTEMNLHYMVRRHMPTQRDLTLARSFINASKVPSPKTMASTFFFAGDTLSSLSVEAIICCSLESSSGLLWLMLFRLDETEMMLAVADGDGRKTLARASLTMDRQRTMYYNVIFDI